MKRSAWLVQRHTVWFKEVGSHYKHARLLEAVCLSVCVCVSFSFSLYNCVCVCQCVYISYRSASLCISSSQLLNVVSVCVSSVCQYVCLGFRLSVFFSFVCVCVSLSLLCMYVSFSFVCVSLSFVCVCLFLFSLVCVCFFPFLPSHSLPFCFIFPLKR